MATQPRVYLNELHSMEPVDINALAVRRLSKLLDHCSINMVCRLTGISRTTLYRWLDEDIVLDKMNHRDAAWFIMLYETKPQMAMLLDRAPSRTHLAHRMLEDNLLPGSNATVVDMTDQAQSSASGDRENAKE